MKSYVHHDSDGTIRALIAVDAPEGVSGMLESEPGIFVAEVEGMDLKFDELDVEKISKLISNHKVQVRTSEPLRLVEKKTNEDSANQ